MTPRWRIHLDPCGGIAGDMFCAALAHAMPELQPDLLRCLSQLALPPEIAPRFESHTDHSLAGLRFVVELPGARGPRDEPADAHDHDHDHSHSHSHSHSTMYLLQVSTGHREACRRCQVRRRTRRKRDRCILSGRSLARFVPSAVIRSCQMSRSAPRAALLVVLLRLPVSSRMVF